MENQKSVTRIIPIADARLARPLPPVAQQRMGAPEDVFGRTLRELRISVTDRCNFRCNYCMPKEVFGRDHAFLPRSGLLSFEQIVRFAKIFKELGVRKVRITGGEPLLRRDIERLIEKLVRIDGLEVTMTTNGSLLARKASVLRAAGLHRLNVSLDALDERTFRAMNDVDFPVAEVLKGIEVAEAAGFASIKINMVVKRGVNDQGILPMARHFRNSGHIVRFIEYMDVGCTNGWELEHVVPSATVIECINAEFPLEPMGPNNRGEVAKRWHYKDGSGEVGVISSVTQTFCSQCTRARISPEGRLFTCLFATDGFDLRPLLLADVSEAEIAGRVAAIWSSRTDRYSELRLTKSAEFHPRIEMSYIGG